MVAGVGEEGDIYYSREKQGLISKLSPRLSGKARPAAEKGE